ncbi:MAG TPA: hypothetical protein VG758_33245 [Hyphomicrobiaceae bacterium]|jgi:hypothetical protein|nr:hypothetical protein [Hyphomicrobiaceae bacterium]
MMKKMLDGFESINAASEAVAPICRTLWPAVKEALPPPLPKPPNRAQARRLRQMAKRAALPATA